MQVINPADGSLITELAEDDARTVSEKVSAAHAAQREWARAPYEARARAVEQFAQLLQRDEDRLAGILTREMGKPITQSHNEIRALADRLAFFLGQTPRELATERVAERASGTEEQIRFEPLGVVANISAWNYPYFVGANVFVPALLTGNAVLYKPSEYSSLTGIAIGELLHEAGIPQEAMQVLVGGADTGRALMGADIDGMFFTGSYGTGRKIAEATAGRMIRVQLELGGKDPAYVCDDVDASAAAAGLADGAFYNAGQSCCAVERIYVHERVWDAFLSAFVETVQGFVVGDPTSVDTYIGPLARRELALDALQEQVDEAVAKGARLLCGGARLERPGYYFAPTVLVDVSHDMRVMTEESFGPIIGLMRVGSDEEAQRLMADTEYGLTAAVYGRDQARAEAVLSGLDVGTAYFNCCDRVSPRLPWSGRGHSGIGCTLSSYGIETFLKPKAWHLR
ncbi:MAG: aldehyde dehydrogenase family protein [Polyangiaceae bacterium]